MKGAQKRKPKMFFKKRSPKTRTEPVKQIRSEAETKASSQPAKTGKAELASEKEAWIEKMLEMMRESERKDPGRYEREKKFWQESGELEQYLQEGETEATLSNVLKVSGCPEAHKMLEPYFDDIAELVTRYRAEMEQGDD